MNCEGYRENHIFNRNFPFEIQISDRPQIMNAHWHSPIELMYFYKSDGCEYICGNNEYETQNDDLMIANSCELHRCLDFGNSSVCCIVVAQEMLDSYSSVMFCNRVSHNPEISGIFSKLKESADSSEFKFIAASCIYSLFAILISDYIYDGKSDKKGRTSLYTDTVNMIMSYVNRHISENLSIDVLASAANLSASRLSHIFKETSGISITDYIEEARLSQALSLLYNTDLSITDISLECGFNNHSYFTYRFRKHFGIAPREYRKIKV